MIENYDITNISLKTKSKAKQRTDITMNINYIDFMEIALNNFKWNGLPDEVKQRYIERSLFRYGSACFFHSELYGYMVLPATMTGDINVYGEPQNWNILGIGFSEERNIDNSVLIRNNTECYPTNRDCLFYAEKITNIERTIDTHIELLKMPYLIKTNDKKLLTMKNILMKKENHELAIFVSGDINANDFEVLNGLQEFIIDDLYTYKKAIKNEYLEMLGFENANIEKKERLLVDEVTANDEITKNGYIQAMLNQRQNACNEINKMFGLNVSVELNRDKSHLGGEEDD